MKSTRVRHNAARILSGNVIFATGQWGIVVVLAKLAGAEALGVYAFANSITAPIFAFAHLGMRQSLATDVDNTYSLTSYLYIYSLASLVALAISLLWVRFSDVSMVLLLVAVGLSIARICENGSQMFYGIFQRQDRVYLIRHSLWFRGVVGLVSFLILISLSKRIDVAVFGIALPGLSH